jgi:hypothetical protein
MSGLWWALGLGCGGLLVLGVIVVAYFNIRDRKNRERAIAEGEHTVGWLVQANANLFQEGVMDLPALVLLSRDKETVKDEAFMTELADRIMALKGVDPSECGDKDEACVAELMSDETYIEGKRDLLPRRFANGRQVYLAHIVIYRDHLPKKRITSNRIPCTILWDEPKSMICTRPVTRKVRRRDEQYSSGHRVLDADYPASFGQSRICATWFRKRKGTR